MVTPWMKVGRFGLGLLVIAFSIGVLWLLLATKPDTKKTSKSQHATQVQVQALTKTDQSVTLVAHGSVIPAVKVKLRPEVSGRIVQIHPQLVPGGRLSSGQVLFRIDPRDYLLEVAHKKAQIAQAQALLHQELGRQKVATRFPGDHRFGVRRYKHPTSGPGNQTPGCSGSGRSSGTGGCCGSEPIGTAPG